MKTTTYKTMVAGVLAWSLITSQASAATTYIRIGGAQAFGNAVHRAIAHILGASSSQVNPPYTLGAGNTYAYADTNPTGGGLNSSTQAIFTGTISGQTVIIKTSFTGSTDGIRLVSTGATVPFLADSLLSGATQTGNLLPNSGNAVENVTPDAAAADSFQGSTVYTAPTLTDVRVGVGAYIFVASKDAPASVGTFGQPVTDPTSAAAAPTTSYYPGLTNITTQQAQALYNVGNLPLAEFTGVDYDRTNLVTPSFQTSGVTYTTGQAPVQVFATGRDYGSGARIVTFIETGIGANANVAQFKPTIAGGAITSQVLYPANTINGIFFPAGSDGNTSNSNLAKTVLPSSTLATLGGYYISYLPSADATNAKNAGAHWLAYNGVIYSPATVSDGSYSLFAYEHILYNSSVSTNQQTILTAFTNQLINTDATILLSTLKVSRPVDGGVITPNY